MVNTTGNIRIGVSGSYSSYTTSSISTNSWSHIVWTISGTTNKIYINGVEALSASLPYATLPALSRIVLGQGSTFANIRGNFDEFAVYGTTLSAERVQAHYISGMQCLSQQLADTWSHVAGLCNGTDLKLLVNGTEQCSIKSSCTNITSPSTNLTAGSLASGANGWSGAIGELQLYGTSDGSAAGTASDIQTNARVTANRYRQNPTESGVISSGLVMNFDAANAAFAAPYSPGCASNQLTWYDSLANGLSGTLANFSSCGSTFGWNGDGTTSVSGTAGPYRLTFSSVAPTESVTINNAISSTLAGDNTYTLQFWLYPNGNAGKIFQWGLYNFDLYGNGIWLKDGWNNGDNILNCSFTVSANSWRHISISQSVDKWRLLVNGQFCSEATWLSNTPDTSFYLGNPSSFQIGYTNTYNGSIATTMIYNRVLSDAEVQQNCNAQKGRFAGATCG